jgi:hypothetical protein
MRFNKPIRDHGEQLGENRIYYLLLLDEVDDDWKMQPRDIPRSGGMELPMGAEPGMSLQHRCTFDAVSSQEGKNVIREKAVLCAGIPIEMDCYLNGRPTLQHVHISWLHVGGKITARQLSAELEALREALYCASRSSGKPVSKPA